MTNKQFKNFVAFLLKEENKVFGPINRPDGFLVPSKISDPEKIVLDGQLTYYNWRKFFLPAAETLFNIHGDVMKKIKVGNKQVLIGPTILDLKALDLYNQVFAEDTYYQERKRNTIVIGQSLAPADQREFAEHQNKFREDQLEHFEFDVFLSKTGDDFRVYTGSEDGQRLLEKFGYKDYENVKYVGPIKEEGPDSEMLALAKKMKTEYNEKLWKEMGDKCINCGKCSLVCPTCYCFNVTDKSKVKAGEGRRVREWSTCFYPDFSWISAKHRFLNNTEKRIYYWYEHKLVRSPEHYNVPGCVRCGRCVKVCPVGISIFDNVARIKSGE